MTILEPQAMIADDGPIPKISEWLPAIGVRIFRTSTGDKLQQKYWRRVGNDFEHEWQDVPIVTEEEEVKAKAKKKRKAKTDPEVCDVR